MFCNPRTVAWDDLRPKNVAYDANGNAIDPEQYRRAMFAVYASLITEWRVYDSTVRVGDQPLLASPATGELYAKLASAIQDRIVEKISELQNPTKTPDGSSS